MIWAAAGVVLGGLVSTVVRTRLGEGNVSVDGGDALWLAIIAAPSIVLALVTRAWPVGPWISVAAIAGWALLLTPAGDTSCVDCGFVLLIPLNLTGIELVLFLVALIVPAWRGKRSRRPRT